MLTSTHNSTDNPLPGRYYFVVRAVMTPFAPPVVEQLWLDAVTETTLSFSRYDVIEQVPRDHVSLYHSEQHLAFALMNGRERRLIELTTELLGLLHYKQVAVAVISRHPDAPETSKTIPVVKGEQPSPQTAKPTSTKATTKKKPSTRSPARSGSSSTKRRR